MIDPIVDAINHPQLTWKNGPPAAMIFDCQPPKQATVRRHFRQLERRMVSLVDNMLLMNKASTRAVVVGAALSMALMLQASWRKDEARAVGDRWLIGTWRGYPVYYDRRLDFTRGGFTDGKGEVIGIITLVNWDQEHTKALCLPTQ